MVQVASDMLAKRYHRSIEELQSRLTEAGREAAERGAGRNEASNEERKRRAQEALQQAGRLQESSEASLQRSVDIVQATEQIGQETAVVFRGQTEQMKNVYADLVEMESELIAANRILVKYGRRISTDKITSCLLIAILLGIIGAVAVRAFSPPQEPEPLPPPGPPGPQPTPIPPSHRLL